MVAWEYPIISKETEKVSNCNFWTNLCSHFHVYTNIVLTSYVSKGVELRFFEASNTTISEVQIALWIYFC